MARLVKGEGSGEQKMALIPEQVTNKIIWDQQHVNANERGQMLPRQGEMGESTPFTRKCTSEPSRTLERGTKPCHILKIYCKQLN